MSETTVTLKRTTCWCGTPFMVPEQLLNAAHNSGHTIYCPHGHTLVWKETEADKLRRERDRLKQQMAQKDDEIAAARRRTEEEMDARHKAEKKLKIAAKRASAGTCPCCNRTVSQMARHMRTKHPTFIAEAVNCPSPSTRSRQQ